MKPKRRFKAMRQTTARAAGKKNAHEESSRFQFTAVDMVLFLQNPYEVVSPQIWFA